MSSFIVRGAPVGVPSGLVVRNYQSDTIIRFPAKSRRSDVTELIIHETVTRSVADTVSVLQNRGLSVQLILGPDGVFTQHGDLASDLMWHAGATHNPPSFGVEVVTPYYPKLLKAGMPWTRTIDAPWAHEGRYVLPTPAQAESIAQLVRWTTDQRPPGLNVPRRWVGLRAGRMWLGPFAEASKASPGIYAHHYFGHADGAWLVLYAWLRLEAGLDPAAAYEEAAKRATGAKGSVDVNDLLKPPRVA